jgi:hypothetical protein
VVWVLRHHGKIDQIEDLSEQKPDFSNDAVYGKPTVQRVRLWFEPLGKEKPSKVWRHLE